MKTLWLFVFVTCLTMGILTGCHRDSGVVMLLDPDQAPAPMMSVERGGTLKFMSISPNSTFTIDDPVVCEEHPIYGKSDSKPVTCHVPKRGIVGLHTTTVIETTPRGKRPRMLEMYIRPCPPICSQ